VYEAPRQVVERGACPRELCGAVANGGRGRQDRAPAPHEHAPAPPAGVEHGALGGARQHKPVGERADRGPGRVAEENVRRAVAARELVGESRAPARAAARRARGGDRDRLERAGDHVARGGEHARGVTLRRAERHARRAQLRVERAADVHMQLGRAQLVERQRRADPVAAPADRLRPVAPAAGPRVGAARRVDEPAEDPVGQPHVPVAAVGTHAQEVAVDQRLVEAGLAADRVQERPLSDRVRSHELLGEEEAQTGVVESRGDAPRHRQPLRELDGPRGGEAAGPADDQDRRKTPLPRHLRELVAGSGRCGPACGGREATREREQRGVQGEDRVLSPSDIGGAGAGTAREPADRGLPARGPRGIAGMERDDLARRRALLPLPRVGRPREHAG
jgi:hypothetical protein